MVTSIKGITSILKKNKDWQSNIDLDQPYYEDIYVNDNRYIIDMLNKLKNKYKLMYLEIEAFSTTNNIIKVKELYELNKEDKPHICFCIKDNIYKLLCVKPKTAREIIELNGSYNQVPLILICKNNEIHSLNLK